MSFDLQPLLLTIDFAASLFKIYNDVRFADPLSSSTRVFQGQKEDTKVNGAILVATSAKTEIQCARHCAQRDGCTQFSYYGIMPLVTTVCWVHLLRVKKIKMAG